MKIKGKWKFSFFIVYALILALLILAYFKCSSANECSVPLEWHFWACVIFAGLTFVQWIAFLIPKSNILTLNDDENAVRPFLIVHFLTLVIATLSLLHEIFFSSVFVEWYRIFAILILLLGTILQLIVGKIIFNKINQDKDITRGIATLRVLSILKFGFAVWVDGFCFALPLSFYLSYGGIPENQFFSISFSTILFFSFMFLLLLNVIFENVLFSKIKKELM